MVLYFHEKRTCNGILTVIIVFPISHHRAYMIFCRVLAAILCDRLRPSWHLQHMHCMFRKAQGISFEPPLQKTGKLHMRKQRPRLLCSNSTADQLISAFVYTPGIYADGVYSFCLSIHPFVCSFVCLLVRLLVTFCVKVLVNVSLVVYISYTNGQKSFVFAWVPYRVCFVSIT